MDYASLKERHRADRENWPQSLSLRIHRALSWLDRAERCGDADGQFIFLWIAFNAAYARELSLDEESFETTRFYEFVGKLAAIDNEHERRFPKLIWENYTESVQTLLKNPYIFNDFWRHQSGEIDEETWKDRFARANNRALSAWMDGDSEVVLRILFSRMYVLRNQLIHGAATWNGSTNESQVVACRGLMQELVPTIIELMMNNFNFEWGDPLYPVVN